MTLSPSALLVSDTRPRELLRGKEARKEEEKAELRLGEATKEFEALALSESKDPLEAAVALLAEIQVTLDRVSSASLRCLLTVILTICRTQVDYQKTESQAATILTGLGFTQEMIDGRYKALSGGWRSRCSLASALLTSSQILLLDEPNNFLDLPSTLWLEGFLAEETERTLVITSHDQEFLNRVVEETIFIRKETLRYFEGCVPFR